MGMVTVPQHFFPVPPFGQADTAANFTAMGTMNASGDRVAWVFQCPKAGTLDQCEIRIGTNTNNPDNGIRISFQDLNASGDPDGGQDQFRDFTSALSSGLWVTPGLMTSDGTDTGVKRTVTRGQWLAVVIDFVSFVASDAFSIAALRTDQITIGGLCYSDDGTTGSYVKGSSSLSPVLALKYDDGSYAEFAWPCWAVSSINTFNYSSGSTPDERANKFVPNAPMRVCGAWFYIDANADYDIVLYDSGSSVLASKTVDKDYGRGGTPIGPMPVLFDTAVSLSAGSTYRIAHKPSASASIIYSYVCPGAAYINALPWGSLAAVMSTRTDGGSWSDSTAEQLLGGLIIDGRDDGTGGGGGGTRAYVG